MNISYGKIEGQYYFYWEDKLLISTEKTWGLRYTHGWWIPKFELFHIGPISIMILRKIK